MQMHRKDWIAAPTWRGDRTMSSVARNSQALNFLSTGHPIRRTKMFSSGSAQATLVKNNKGGKYGSLPSASSRRPNPTLPETGTDPNRGFAPVQGKCGQGSPKGAYCKEGQG